ncbi:MAG: LysR family transcriptional regulator [Alphaproteobacteria bacterium]|nr:LysR family transcriptional regulator [Alphaproteobacteria bacterium]OJV45677.1 MAG: hypothetical protein BGO28_02325 [Alphaproteobacteria bacterium 43-37]
MSGFLGSPLQKINIEFLRSFYACAHFNSRKRAANYLGIAESTISYHIAGVESELGVLLFHRLNAGYHLTQEGEVLYEVTGRLFDELSEAHLKILSLNYERPLQQLRVYTTIPLGVHYLPTVISEFQKTYPNTAITLVSFTEMPEIRTDHIDVLISPFKPEHLSFESQHVCTMVNLLYAHQSYLGKAGSPQSLKELENQKFITVRQAGSALYGADWFEKQLKKHKINPRFNIVTTNSLTAIQMAKHGMGICSYAKEMVRDLGYELHPILEEQLNFQSEIYISAQKFLFLSSCVQEFLKTFKKILLQRIERQT